MASDETEFEDELEVGVLNNSGPSSSDGDDDGSGWDERAAEVDGEDAAQTAESSTSESGETIDTTTEPASEPSPETSETAAETEDTAEESAEQTTEDDSTKVRDMATVTMRMPEEDKQRLVNRWKKFEFMYHNENEAEVRKNHTFHPALIQAAFSNRHIDEVLDELIEEGVEEIGFLSHEPSD